MAVIKRDQSPWLWVLRAPNGKLIVHTASTTRGEAWVAGFQYVASMNPYFGNKYWKRWDASLLAARKLGWRIVRARLVEVEHGVSGRD